MNRGAWWATVHQVTEESDTTEATWWQVWNPISRSQVQGLVPGHGCRAPHQCHLWNWPSLIVTTAKSSPPPIFSNQLPWQKYLPWWSPYRALTNHLMPRFQQAFSLSWDYKVWLLAHEERWLSHEPVCCSNSVSCSSDLYSPFRWLSLVCQECLQYPHWLSSLFLMNTLPSVILCILKFFSGRAWATKTAGNIPFLSFSHMPMSWWNLHLVTVQRNPLIKRHPCLPKTLNQVVSYYHFQTPFIAACVCACVLSHFSRARLLSILWTVVYQAPLSMGFSRQEYWSGLLFPNPGDLPDPGIKPTSLMSPALAGGVLPLAPTGQSFHTCLFAFYSQLSNDFNVVTLYWKLYE